jgi:hypothetical protein
MSYNGSDAAASLRYFVREATAKERPLMKHPMQDTYDS